ncbi:hypothetical protein [Sphingobacterium lumbrici]|uniref:hypothetical protein n=1 Tax=Sphingobacterium lumbrici TaxID=2559600 RepID=UPI001129A5AC|nr:hypothetical protein [Sphingobacterium lumbrici]
MKTQKEIFDFIAQRFKTKETMHAAIADLFSVEASTASKWSYGTTILGLDRLKVLVDHFELKPADLFSSVFEEVSFSFMPLDMDDLGIYYRYMLGLAARLEQAAASGQASISFIADEVPIFHFMFYTNLTYFKLYSYAYDMLKFNMKYEEFVERLEAYDLKSVFRRIAKAYERITSVEVWDDYVLDAVLFQIEHMEILDHYADLNSKKIILQELLDMIERFKLTSIAGQKPSGVKLEFFRKDSPIRIGYMLVNDGAESSLSIKVDTINSMSTRDHRAIAIFSRSFRAAIDKSTYVGNGGERERTIYYRNLIARINRAMHS